MDLNSLILRKAQVDDAQAIWDIISHAKEDMHLLGRTQWQDGYPDLSNIFADIESGNGYVLDYDNSSCIVAYSAIILTGDPHYNTIDGAWLTKGSHYVVVHRLAINPGLKGCGIATRFISLVEKYAKSLSYKSLRIDTNYDNLGMLSIMTKLQYTPCGVVTLPTGTRKAYEKLL